MRAAGLIAVGIAFAALTGCASQMAALAPVGGGDITVLRIATVDVLQELGIDMMQVPVCTEDPDARAGYTCSGTTSNGKAIAVTSPDSLPMSIVISVDGKVVFEGEVRDVIDKAARETP